MISLQACASTRLFGTLELARPISAATHTTKPPLTRNLLNVLLAFKTNAEVDLNQVCWQTQGGTKTLLELVVPPGV